MVCDGMAWDATSAQHFLQLYNAQITTFVHQLMWEAPHILHRVDPRTDYEMSCSGGGSGDSRSIGGRCFAVACLEMEHSQTVIANVKVGLHKMAEYGQICAVINACQITQFTTFFGCDDTWLVQSDSGQ